MSLQYSDLIDFEDFNEFETVETITMLNGYTVTEGSDNDRLEFFSLGMYDLTTD